MDLNTITDLLTTHESYFRTIIATAKPNISGDALKGKITSHCINLIVIAGAKYPMETDTLDDPLLSTSSSQSNSKSNSKDSRYGDRRRKRRTSPSTPKQVSAIPLGRSTSYSKPMQPSGASRLFSSRKKETIIIDSDDDSVGSPAEEVDEMFVSPTSSSRRKTRSSRCETRSKNRFGSRAEKEKERKRGRHAVMGMSAASSSSSGHGSGGERYEENGIDAAGFEGGKDGAGHDSEMEELIRYADDDEEEQEVEAENEDEDESPKKKRRSL